ncbi:MAG: hypothetical protein R3258_01300 [Acidimicrobiia bacterium]|nr:hypothetical protein [Acidimicrobiia bacterium]
MRSLTAALLLVVFACAEPLAPLEGVDLPPASLPDQIEQGGWSVAFIHEFGEGFWEEGDHVYQLALACPEIEAAPINTPPIFFEVGPLNLPVDHVYLRVGGPADSRLGPPNVGAFNPQQTTTAVITVLGITESQAQRATESCSGTVTWDLTGSAELLPLEIFQP